jgi:hypothetical protein
MIKMSRVDPLRIVNKSLNIRFTYYVIVLKIENIRKLPKKANLDGEGSYQIVNPYRLYLGKSYSEWATDWFNWFLSANADRRNAGPVVFLRSRGLPNSNTGAYISDVPNQGIIGPDSSSGSFSADTVYNPSYVNDPNIRIGSDRLQIFLDQVIFIPIIVAYSFASIEPGKDWGRMQDFTGLTIDYGDDPPNENQLTINNEDLKLPARLNMEQFRIVTPIFTAVLPEAPYGTSIRDFLEDAPVQPGSYPALVEGYFVILKFTEPGSYWVHSWASAPRERSGPYFSELLYQIEVNTRERKGHRGLLTEGSRALRSPTKGLMFEEPIGIPRPARNERVFNRTLCEKKKIGELTDPEIKRFQEFFSSSSDK